jgi:hypothetical protein
MTELIDIAVRLKHETEKAYFVETGEGDMWLPKSQVEFYAQDNIVTMPYWLAKEKGLV